MIHINTLRIGDLIVRTKGPFSAHYLVYVGIINGVKMVAENQFGKGVQYTTLKNALAGNPIKRIEPFEGSETERSKVIPKINRLIGKTYDLIAFNCEHFARGISKGKIESKQVRIVGTISILIVLAFALILINNRNN